jgi:hydrogenase maturation protease
VEIVQRLSRVQPPIAADVMEAGEAGVGLIGLFEGYERVLLVDCARMGLPPGTHRVFRREEVWTRRDAGLGGHAADPLGVLDLAALLGRTPEVQFLAVEPECLEGAFRLSSAVRRAIPALLEEIRRLTEQGAWAHASGTHSHR